MLLLFTSFLNEESTDVTPISAPIYQADTLWVDSVLTSLTQEQKIAQLFMVAAYSNKGEKHQKEIEFLKNIVTIILPSTWLKSGA